MPTLKELLAAKNASRRVGGGDSFSSPPKEKMPVANAGQDEIDHRELQSPVPGESIPDEFPGPDSDDYFWKEAYAAFASELAIVVEPAPSPWAWIAVVRRDKGARPILLSRLPLSGRAIGEGADSPF